MNFYCFNHQNKPMPLVRALQTHGYNWTARAGNSEFILTDTDSGTRQLVLKELYQKGKKIFVYPHTARPDLHTDFPGYECSNWVTVRFVSAPGHIEVLKRIGIPHEMITIGWFLSEICPFEPRHRVFNVLFAPIHPNANRLLSAVDLTVNKAVYNKLLPLARSGRIKLMVRYIYSLESNGLRHEDGIIYKEGSTAGDPFHDMISADVVVSHQTFAWMAVAKGIPTVMMGENIPPHVGDLHASEFRWAKSWKEYLRLIKYPLDILDEGDTYELLQRAGESDAAILDWKTRMIGEAFDPEKFVQIVENYL